MVMKLIGVGACGIALSGGSLMVWRQRSGTNSRCATISGASVKDSLNGLYVMTIFFLKTKTRILLLSYSDPHSPSPSISVGVSLLKIRFFLTSRRKSM